MSYHVYVARPGFEKSPISGDEWLAAASTCPLLRVVTTTNRKGKVHHSVRLSSDASRHIWHLPIGVIDAQAPNAQVIEALFAVASNLQADVYSEKRRRFVSVRDWEDRTRSYHAQLAASREKALNVRRRARFRFFVLLVAVVTLGVGLLWLLRYAA
jgi:hypothetical protein